MKTIKISNPELALLLLRSARQCIEWDLSSYVCLALSRVISTQGNDYSEAWYSTSREIKDWIEILLDGESNLENWILREHPYATDGFVMWTEEARAKMKETRLAWIDWMISELKGGL